MKKIFKRTLPLLLAAVMLLSTATLGGLADFLSVDAHATEYQVGDIVEFGSYPQTEVKDEATLNALNAKSLSWKSYGYYSGTGDYHGSMTSSDYMKYADVTYSGTKYRAVKFTEYRPSLTYDASSDSKSNQDDNGYVTNTTYWFKYEPLKWRVLDPNEGLIMCETIIDSQAYSNTIYYNNDFWNNSSYTNYANDYETSSIRKWLNDDFYNLAFTSDQQSSIKTTTLDNSAYNSEYDSATTSDKVFLLSWGEVHNTSYGFDSDFNAVDTAREAKGSDYAKCQGIDVASNENSSWWLRSPGYIDSGASTVSSDGYVDRGYSVSLSSFGVRPALKISNLSSTTENSANANGNSDLEIDENGNIISENGENAKNTLPATAIIGIAAAVVVVAGVVAGIVLAKKKK